MERLPGQAGDLPRYRVNRIDTVGFTNLPIAAGMLSPINNRAKAPATPAAPPQRPAPKPVVRVDARMQVGVRVFNRIVEIVRNRTGLPHDRAFNSVLQSNRDLLTGTYSGPECTGSLQRLLNRAAPAMPQCGPVAVVERTVKKIDRVADKFFPLLNREPSALKWNAVERAVSALEKHSIPGKLLNQAARVPFGVSPQDWKSANTGAGAVLDFIETEETKDESGDIGHTERFQNQTPAMKFAMFQGLVEQLRADGLTVQQAFDKIKETQPVFWANAILSYESSVKNDPST